MNKTVLICALSSSITLLGAAEMNVSVCNLGQVPDTVVALSTFAVPGCRLSNTPGPVVKLKIMTGQPVVENVYLNGHGPYRFLLDTGAEPNVLEANLARKLGIQATVPGKMITPAGVSAAGYAAVGRVSLGPSEATDQLFLLTRLDGTHATSPDIRGILGQSFLSQFDYLIDFEKRELVFGKAATSRPPIPFRVIGKLITIATSEGDFILDSGIGTLCLFRASVWPRRTGKIQASSRLTSRVGIARAPELRIGAQVYHPGRAAFDARGRAAFEMREDAAAVDGLLPASLFHAVFVCNSAGYVVIDP